MTKPDSTKALGIGLAGIAVTALGLLVSGAHIVATAWLVGLGFWTAVAIGMLMMILIHHIFDASWSTVLRRQYEHGLAAFPWLLLLFLPLVAASFLGQHDLVWPWMNPDAPAFAGPRREGRPPLREEERLPERPALHGRDGRLLRPLDLDVGPAPEGLVHPGFGRRRPLDADEREDGRASGSRSWR